MRLRREVMVSDRWTWIWALYCVLYAGMSGVFVGAGIYGVWF